jgi:hypothetical protein
MAIKLSKQYEKPVGYSPPPSEPPNYSLKRGKYFPPAPASWGKYHGEGKQYDRQLAKKVLDEAVGSGE